MGWFNRETRDADAGEIEARMADVTDIGIAFDRAVAAATAPEASALPAVFRAEQLIADGIAGLDLTARDARGELIEPTPDILTQPNPQETYHDTMNRIAYSLLRDGNAYFKILTRNNRGEVTSGVVADPADVTVVWDRDRMFPVYYWRGRQQIRNLNIIHIPLNLFPGEVKGLSPIQAARFTAIAEGTAQSAFGLSLFEDNASPKGVLHSDQKLTKAEAEHIRDVWEASHKGRNRPAVTSGSVTFNPTQMKPVDAEFIQSRNFTIQEVARMYGLSGLFLNVDTGSSLTYSTTESLFRLLLTATLAPTYLERIEQAFSVMLPRGIKAKFDVSQILRADIQTRYESYRVGLEAGFLTINEVRHMEGLAPIAGADRPAEPIREATS